MTTGEQIRFTSAYDRHTAATRISESFREPRIRDGFFPVTVYLGGEIKSDSVVLRRHRGGWSYAHFEGRLAEDGSGSLLEGRLVRHTPNAGHFIGAGLIVVGVVAVVVGLLAWQGRPTTVLILVGVLLGTVAAGVVRFSSANADAEVDLLKRDILVVLGRPGV